LDLTTEYIEQDQPWVDYHSTEVGAILREDHNEVETTNLTWNLRAEAAITDRWTLAVVLPFVHREHLHLAGESHSGDGEDNETDGQVTIGDATGVPERWNFTRLGDLRLTASYAVLQGRRPEEVSLHLIAGLKLPTGDTNVRNDAGEEAEITLQPGTASVEPIFGVAVQRSFSVADSGTPWPVSAGFHVRTEGSDGKFGYRPGTEVVTSLATEYPVTQRFRALGQINFRYRDRDHVGDAPGVLAEDTGNEALYLTPGMRLDLTDAFGAYTYVQVPVLQRVNGIQLVSRWNLLVGLTYKFDI
jgi:hypothetical protein